MNYQEVEPISREDANKAFMSGNTSDICYALVSVTFHNSDWQWVQGKCISFLQKDDKDVQSLAVTCLGHLARIHHRLDLDMVLPLLNNLQQNPELKGCVEDALDDIQMYIKR